MSSPNTWAKATVLNDWGSEIANVTLKHRYDEDRYDHPTWLSIKPQQSGVPLADIGYWTGFLRLGSDYWQVEFEADGKKWTCNEIEYVLHGHDENSTVVCRVYRSGVAGKMEIRCPPSDGETVDLFSTGPAAPRPVAATPAARPTAPPETSQPAEPVETADPTMVEATAVPEALSWEEMLPLRASPNATVPYVSLNRPNGQPPTLTYGSYTESGGAAEGVDETSDEIKAIRQRIDKTIDEIKAIRQRIPTRNFHVDANTNKGNLYFPSGQGAGYRIGKDETSEYQRYVTIRSQDIKYPTGADQSPIEEKKWAYYTAVSFAEGKMTTITAGSVDVHLTIGPGFATSGHAAQAIMQKVFALNKVVSDRAFAAGLKMELVSPPGQTARLPEFKVVDVENKCILLGVDATRYISANLPLLSLIADVCIGALGDIQSDSAGGDASSQAIENDEAACKAQIQAMLDAQWQQYCAITLGTTDVSSWPLPPDLRYVVMLHARHAGDFALSWDGSLSGRDGTPPSADAVAENVWAFLKNKYRTKPLTVIAKARAICDAWAGPKGVIRTHISSEIDGYDYAKSRAADKNTPVTWK